jgi:tellurite resistance protein
VTLTWLAGCSRCCSWQLTQQRQQQLQQQELAKASLHCPLLQVTAAVAVAVAVAVVGQQKQWQQQVVEGCWVLLQVLMTWHLLTQQ